MTTAVDALSLWYGDEPATRINGAGRIVDPQGKPFKTLKLPWSRWHRDRPQHNVEDWCVTVTTTNGETIHSEVTAQEREHGHIRLTLPEQTAVYLP